MREVEIKADKLRGLKHEERHDFLHDHAVPTILAPDGGKYMIDHHHLVRAAWEAGLDEVVSEVKADLSKLGLQPFWERMKKEGWVYLHDQFGKGPHEPELLPLDVRGLADDPFRSLAWAVRDKKGFHKSPTPFSEFHWSEFLRKHITENPMRMGFKKALEQALKLCHLPEAKKLPGYVEDQE